MINYCYRSKKCMGYVFAKSIRTRGPQRKFCSECQKFKMKKRKQKKQKTKRKVLKKKMREKYVGLKRKNSTLKRKVK